MTGSTASSEQENRSAAGDGRRVLHGFKQPDLEHAYRDHLFTTRRRSVLACLLIALLLVAVVEPLAALWSPVEIPAIAGQTRWLVNVPALALALLTFLLTGDSRWKERTLLLALACTLMTNAASLAAANVTLQPIYNAASLQIALFGFLLLGLRFTPALLGAGIGYVAAVALAAHLSSDGGQSLLQIQLMPAMILGGLVFAAYILDQNSRAAFLAERKARAADAARLAVVGERNRWLKVGNDYLNHEIKNALLGISSSLQLLQRRNQAPGLDAIIDRAGRSTQFMQRLLMEVSESTSLESALGEIEFDRVDLGALLALKIADYREVYPDQAFSAEGADTATVRCDPDRMVQVMDKLVDNAVRHATPGTAVALSLGVEQHGVLLEVFNACDSQPELTEGIFDPFVTGGEGFGLGLYVVKRIVEAHGGSVKAVSIKDPPGASFRVSLPGA